MKLLRRLLVVLAVASPSGACAPEEKVSGSGGSGGLPASGSGGGAQAGSGGAGGGPGGSGGSGAGGSMPDAATGGAGGSMTDAPVDGAEVAADALAADTGVDVAGLPRFSFFVTSLTAMRRLSGSQNGFGGDLRYGEATGLAGADKICREIAEAALPGAGAKTWRAFLSTVAGPVHAIDRIGEGPWYDRMGRVLAMNKAALLNPRPMGADPTIINDLPNENGIPNHTDGAPGCVGNTCPDNHDFLTGTNAMGRVYSTNPLNTCNDWTSAAATNPGGRPNGPWCGHSWPRMGSGVHWIASLTEGGCGPGVQLQEMGGPMPGVYTVGTGGGYGGFYCFALTP